MRVSSDRDDPDYVRGGYYRIWLNGKHMKYAFTAWDDPVFGYVVHALLDIYGRPQINPYLEEIARVVSSGRVTIIDTRKLPVPYAGFTREEIRNIFGMRDWLTQR